MHLKQSKAIGDAGPPVLKTLEDIISRGRETGVFRRDIEPLDLHMLISSQCFFRVTNKHTFGTLFQCDLSVPDIYQRHRQMVVDSVLAYVTTDCSGSQWAAP
jgi:hypothetical protein